MSRWIGVLVLVALGCVACGGETPQSPGAPSATGATGGPAASQGATITGSVTAGAPLAAMSAQVVGTSVSSPVGTGGDFSLTRVPEGGVQLRFVGSGVDASVALSPVKSGDAVSLLVGISGATAVIESESRNAGGQVELEGRIESLPPTQAPNTLIVAGRTVTTGTQTVIRDDNTTRTFAALAIGQRVHVKGKLDGAKIAADTIIIQNTDTSIQVNVNGTVETLTGTAAAFTFFVSGREIRGAATTVFYGDNDVPLTFSALKNGLRVEVKGEQRDAFVFAVRIHINGPTTPEPPQDDSASVEGRLNAKTGTDPALTLTIGTTIVKTSAATEVQRRGDVQTLAALAIGQTVHAVGTRMADGSLDARKLQIKDDDTGGAFVIEGSRGGLKGTCPNLSFGVNGYSIVTTSATGFVPTTACADLKSGTKVEVEGLRQADGSVTATKVTRK